MPLAIPKLESSDQAGGGGSSKYTPNLAHLSSRRSSRLLAPESYDQGIGQKRKRAQNHKTRRARHKSLSSPKALGLR